MLPLTVTDVVPAGPEVGLSTIVGTTVKVRLIGVTPSVAAIVCAPAVLVEGIVTVAEKEPSVALAVTTGGFVVNDTPSSVIPIWAPLANCVPATVTTVPVGPEVGVSVVAADL